MARKTLKEMPKWLVKIYKFNEYLTPDGNMPLKTNLCHFCRVVFFWVPIKFAVATIIVGAVSFALFYLFFIMIPDTHWLLHWILWSVITGAFIFWYLADNYKTPAQMLKSVVDVIPEPPQWWEELFDVLAAWWEAIEDQICPLLDLKDENEEKSK